MTMVKTLKNRIAKKAWHYYNFFEIPFKCAVLYSIIIPLANLASMDYYKMSVDEFRKHPVAVEAVGNPVRFRYMNLGRKDIQVNHEKAQV